MVVLSGAEILYGALLDPYPEALTESLQVAQLLPEQLLGHLRIPVLVRIREPIATRRHRSANPP